MKYCPNPDCPYAKKNPLPPKPALLKTDVAEA